MIRIIQYYNPERFFETRAEARANLTPMPEIFDPMSLINWASYLEFPSKTCTEPYVRLKRYDKVVSKYPDFADVWDNRGWCLRNLKRYAEALASHDKALQLKTTNPFTTWFNRGIVLELLQRPAEAKTSYQQAINSYSQLTSTQQNDPENLYLRGWVFFLLQSYSEAVNSLQQAIQLEPLSRHLFDWVFPLFANFPQESIYLGQQVAKSLDSYTLNIVPTDYDAWRNLASRWLRLGEQWEKLNQWQEAIIAYDKVLAIKPDDSRAIEGKKKVINRSV